MSCRWFRRLALALSCTASLGFAAAPASAGDLWAWLRGKPAAPAYPVAATTAYYPHAAYYPYNAYYPTAAASYYAPTAAYGATTAYAQTTAYAPAAVYAPTAVYRPVVAPTAMVPTTAYYGAAAAAGCPHCRRPAVVNYAPNVNYRTAWMPVPVTYYRPIAGIDPTTGQPTTVMYGCTAPSYQIQRYPAIVQSPVMATAAPCGVGCANGACGVAPVASAPYYLPQGAAPIVGAPTTIVPGAYGAAQPPVGSYPTSPARVLPADQAPSLNPGGIQYGPQAPAAGGTLNYPPPTTYGNGTQNGATYSYAPQANGYGSVPNGYQNGVSNGAVQNGPVNGSTNGTSNGSTNGAAQPNGTLYQNGTPYNNGASSNYGANGSSSTATQPMVPVTPSYGSPQFNPSSSTPKNEMQVKPVPDPEPPQQDLDENGVPLLIDRRDRSASAPVRRPLLFTPVKRTEPLGVDPGPAAMPLAPPLSLTSPGITLSAPTLSAPKKLDDSGWKSLGK